MNYIKTGIFALILLNWGNNAFAGSCDSTDEGVFKNPALDSQFNEAQVSVKPAPKNTMIFEVVIPCGSKLTPTTLYASCPEHGGHYEALVQEEGGSQCSLGANPRISIIGNELTIYTKIRTPGFNGRYKLSR